MLGTATVTSCKFGAWATMVFVLFFAAGVWETSPGLIGVVFRVVTSVLEDSGTQWIIFLFFFANFAAFLGWRLSSPWQAGAAGNPLRLARQHGDCLWILFPLTICALDYARYYASSTEARTLIAGALLGQGIVAWAGVELKNQRPEVRNRLWLAGICLLMVFLAVGSVWRAEDSHDFEYQGHSRWTGPWENPNIFGLLMAAGFMLAAGVAGAALKTTRQRHGTGHSRKSWLAGQAVAMVCVVIGMLMARGLFHSYSRGAWLGTLCGLAYLCFRCPAFRCPIWLKTHWRTLSVVAISGLVLCFWHFRQTDWHPAHRAFSAVNAADFSWRNRVAAWVGDLQITAEHPWLGAGWNQPEPLYANFYLPPRLNEGLAIEMNDYLLLVATLGIPAFFCLGVYLWLSLSCRTQGDEAEGESLQPGAADEPGSAARLPWSFTSLQAICRAGVIVLLVGFWFDGGLFKLPTAATFWILLEMGGLCNRQFSRPVKVCAQRLISAKCVRGLIRPGRMMSLTRVLPATASGNRLGKLAPADTQANSLRSRPGLRCSSRPVTCAWFGDG